MAHTTQAVAGGRPETDDATSRRRPWRRAPAISLLLAVIVTISACTDEGAKEVADTPPTTSTATPSADKGTAAAEVGADGFDVTAGQARVRAPAHVAAAGTTVRVQGVERDTTPFSNAATEQVGAAQWLTTGNGIEVVLGDGQQPAAPITIALPTPGPRPKPDAIAVIVSESADGTLNWLPATVDDAGTFTGETDHLSRFLPAWFDLGGFWSKTSDFARGAVGVQVPRPDCAGRPAEIAGQTVDVPQVENGQLGDTMLWTCVAPDPDDPDRALVTLTSNVGYPVQVTPTGSPRVAVHATADIVNVATGHAFHAQRHLWDAVADLFNSPDAPRDDTVVVPGATTTLSWPVRDLPAQIDAQPDLSTQILGAFAFAVVEGAGRAAQVPGDVRAFLTAMAVGGCFVKVGQAVGTLTTAPSATTIGQGLVAAASCGATVAKGLLQFVLGVVVGGLSQSVATWQALWHKHISAITGETSRWRVTVTPPPAPGLDALTIGMSLEQVQAIAEAAGLDRLDVDGCVIFTNHAGSPDHPDVDPLTTPAASLDVVQDWDTGDYTLQRALTPALLDGTDLQIGQATAADVEAALPGGQWVDFFYGGGASTYTVDRGDGSLLGIEMGYPGHHDGTVANASTISADAIGTDSFCS